MSDTNRRRQIEISAQLPFKKTEDVIHSVQQEVRNHGQPYGTRQKRQGHKGDTVLPVANGEFHDSQQGEKANGQAENRGGNGGDKAQHGSYRQ